MEKIKRWLKEWDFSRIFRMGLGIALIIAFFSTKENIYLFGGIVLSAFAILNIGCPGNSCKTNIPEKNKDEIIKTEEFNPIKK